MFDNIQSANNTRSNKSDINVNLYEDSYGSCDNTTARAPMDSQSTRWSRDATRLNLSGDASNQLLSLPSLELVDPTDRTQTSEKAQTGEKVFDLAQAPTEVLRRINQSDNQGTEIKKAS